jgi:hypothetical protein
VVVDRICVTRLRLHPAEVWGATWFELRPFAPRPYRKPNRPPSTRRSLVGIREAARICQVSFTTFNAWVIAGKVLYTMPKGVRLFRRSDLEALAADAVA